MKKLVVAIFEDVEINRFIYENLLRTKSDKIEVHLFGDAEKGIEASKTIDFDIVFIEVHFWGQNFAGVEILERLKKTSRKKFTSLAMTSLLQPGDDEVIFKGGFTMVIEKPITFESIEMLHPTVG